MEAHWLVEKVAAARCKAILEAEAKCKVKSEWQVEETDLDPGVGSLAEQKG